VLRDAPFLELLAGVLAGALAACSSQQVPPRAPPREQPPHAAVDALGAVNGDGAPDFGFHALLPTNRDDVDVDASFVYVSDLKERRYCFTDWLNSLVLSPNGKVENDLARALAERVARRGQQVLECPRTFVND
jgi:hypothetical protein